MSRCTAALLLAIIPWLGLPHLAWGEAEPPAVQEMEAEVSRDPLSPAARELGLLRGRQGEFRQSYRWLRPWVQAHPDDHPARLAAAQAALRLDRLTEAAELAQGLDPGHPGGRALRAQVAHARGQHSVVLEELEPLLDSPPPGVEKLVLWLAAQAHLATGSYRSAVELLAGRTGGDTELALLLARGQYQSGELEEALATLAPAAARILGREPRDDEKGLAAPLLLEQGRYLVAGGRFEEAATALRRVVELEPGNRPAWQVLAQALAALEEHEEAQRALARLQELGPPSGGAGSRPPPEEDPTSAALRRATQALGAGRPHEALILLHREAELAPEDPRPYLMAGQILLQLGRLEEAETVAEQVARVAPGLADSRYLWGVLRLARGDLAAAEGDLRAALALAPDHGPALNDLAVLLEARGERQEARELLERALAINPADETARANLRRLDEDNEG